MKMIERVFIANRGEIAIRIIKTLNKMGIESVVAYTAEDKHSFFVELADIAVPFEGEGLQETYLNSKQIIQFAKQFRADAIHPGYGFLSENAHFAEACEKAGLIFIGPPISAIKLMGDKVASRRFAEEHNIPLLKGITGSQKELLSQEKDLQYPVIIKASAGGGGKGMRIVREPSELKEALESTAREAKNYFGNDEVFIERYIENPRHIEVQILADQLGNTVHLFERECTIQRRHQKIIEEALSDSLNDSQRDAITNTAIQLAKAAKYYSLGTVEFIVDEEMNFYFMEMNTRIQVEHPVTELITDLDLVEQQIIVAQGKELIFDQQEITHNGHAIECRIYAEDPEHDFRPAPGTITFYSEPELSEVIRIDSSLNGPGVISDAYDPMIAKVTTWGEHRQQAIDMMQFALEDFIIEGIKTNIDYLLAILNDEDFQDNKITTNYCKLNSASLIETRNLEKQETTAHSLIIAAVLFDLDKPKTNSNSIWEQIGYFRLIPQFNMQLEQEIYPIKLEHWDKEFKTIHINQQKYTVRTLSRQEDGFWFEIDGEDDYAKLYSINANSITIVYEGFQYHAKRLDVLDDQQDFTQSQDLGAGADSINSPIPGKVIKVNKSKGDQVKKGEPIIIVEAMKMENELVAPRNGIIEEILVKTNDKVQAGEVLANLKQEENE